MSIILSLRNIEKHYKDFSLHDFSFSIGEGEVIGLVGPNGAGKTTIIKIIMGLVRPDGGEIEYFGLDWEEHEVAIKSKIGFVSDECHLPDHMTPTFAEKMMRSFYRNWDRGRYHNYIEQYELPLKKPVGQFSKGMKMKLSLAIALSHRPELVIMDEPTSGLDPLVRKFLLEEIETISKRDKTSFLFSSHIISDLQDIAHSIIILKNGRIIYYSSVDELLNRYPKDKKFDDIVLSLLEGG